MPYKIETLKIKLPKNKWYDRRYKLTEQEKDEIRENIEWLSMRKLWLKYKVDRKTIAYIIYPERYEQMLAAAKERRKDWRYYDKDKHRKAMKKTRRYRYDVLWASVKSQRSNVQSFKI